MYIALSKSMPNNAQATFHKVFRVELGDSASVIISSYLDQTMAQILWQDTYEVSDAAFVTSSPKTDVLNWLVSAGQAFDGGTVVVEGSADLTIAKAVRWALIKAQRAEVLAITNVEGVGLFDSDLESRVFIAGEIQALNELNEPDSFELIWKMADNTTPTITKAQLIEAGLAVRDATKTVMAKSFTLFNQISAATTVEDVNAIVWQ